MSPDEMGRRCMAWVLGDVAGPGGLDLSRTSFASESTGRRVTCVESEGPRRTWTLWQGTRQVGLVRMRNPAGEDMQRDDPTQPDDCRFLRMALRSTMWTVEASDRTRLLLGLDDAPESGQTGT